MEKRPALGKGLSALIPDAPAPAPRPATSEVDIDRLSPNTFQPRTEFDDARLADLAQSIRSNGVIQPIVVHRHGDRFRIIAGERRWRAAQLAGLTRVPVVVREAQSDQALLEMALIENIQREDLNAIEAAHAYRRLAEEFHMTQEDIATAVGKDRATVANFLRLLRLPAEIQAQVSNGALTMGHARALLALPRETDQLHMAHEIIQQGWPVRRTEELVKLYLDPPRPVVQPEQPATPAERLELRSPPITSTKADRAPSQTRSTEWRALISAPNSSSLTSTIV